MRIAFWGTPEFATPSLRALIGEGHDVVAVVTRPDRPRRKGGRARGAPDPSPVKRVALEENIPVLEPETPREPGFLEGLRALEPDVSVVIAYGHILPQQIIDLPRFGTFNVHGSLLPAYRGAAPIQAAIRDGCSETGVTVIRMVPALDAGPIVLALSTPIGADETAGELQLRLAELGAQAVVEALALLSLGKAAERPQDEARVTWARKVEREDARVRWTEPAEAVARLVRAYDPRPGAWTTCREVEVRLFGARATAGPLEAPGTVLDVRADGMTVACGSGAARIAEVHPAGGKRLSAAAWARGRGARVGDLLV